MFATLKRAFSPLDTTDVDAAIAEATSAHRGVRVRARALRMDVSCSNPGDAIAVLRKGTLSAAENIINQCFGAPRPTPADMQELLGKI
jgi:hypothetical protein